MASVIRQDVKSSPEDLYRQSLEDRLKLVKGKRWAELTPEEKDLISEWTAFKGGFISAP